VGRSGDTLLRLLRESSPPSWTSMVVPLFWYAEMLVTGSQNSKVSSSLDSSAVGLLIDQHSTLPSSCPVLNMLLSGSHVMHFGTDAGEVSNWTRTPLVITSQSSKRPFS